MINSKTLQLCGLLAATLLLSCGGAKETASTQVSEKESFDFTNEAMTESLMDNLRAVALAKGEFFSMQDQQTYIFKKEGLSLQYIRWVDANEEATAEQMIMYYPLEGVTVAGNKVEYVRTHYDFNGPYCDTKLGGERNPMAFVLWNGDDSREMAFDLNNEEACTCYVQEPALSDAENAVVTPLVWLIRERVNFFVQSFLVS